MNPQRRFLILALAFVFAFSSLSFVLREVYLQRLDLIPIETLVAGNLTSTLSRKLKNGGDPNFVNQNGDPLICIAISERRNWKSVQLLLKHGARVDVKSSDGNSPYMVAVNSDNETALKLLFEHRPHPPKEEILLLIENARMQSIREFLTKFL